MLCVACCLLIDVRCLAFVVSRWLFAGSCVLCVCVCSLSAACCLSSIVVCRCLVCVVCGVRCVVCSSFGARCLRFIVWRCLSFVDCCVLFVV